MGRGSPLRQRMASEFLVITATSLYHPTMIRKIQTAMDEAGTNQGRFAWVEDKNGHNIIHCKYKNGAFIFHAFYADGGMKDITESVKLAFKRFYEGRNHA